MAGCMARATHVNDQQASGLKVLCCLVYRLICSCLVVHHIIRLLALFHVAGIHIYVICHLESLFGGLAAFGPCGLHGVSGCLGMVTPGTTIR